LRRRADLEKTIPVPANLAAKLTALGQDIAQVEADVRARADELAALTPVYDQACAAVKEAVAAECGQAKAYAYAECELGGQEALAEVLQAAGEPLLRLWVARRTRGFGIEVPSAKALAQLVVDSPDAEPDPAKE